MAAVRGVTFVGASFGNSGNNLTSGSWALPANWLPGDFAIFVWASRESGRTFTEPGTVTQKVDFSSAGFGHLFIGYRTLVAGDTTFAWTATSSTNNTDGFYTVVFRDVNGSAADPFERTSAANPATFSNTQSPDPPALSAATILDKDVVATVFAKNNDYGGSITVPATYSGDTAARYDETGGTDGSSGFAWLLDVAAGTTSNPGAWTLGGASTDDGLQWTFALRSNVRNTLTADAVIKATISSAFTADAVIKKTITGGFTADAVLLRTVRPGEKYEQTVLAGVITSNFGSDAETSTNPERRAQSFLAPATGELIEIAWDIGKNGAPADNVVVELQTDASNAPSETVIGTLATVSGASLSTTPGLRTDACSAQVASGTKYWLVFKRSGSLNATDNYVTVNTNTSYGGGTASRYFSSAWSEVISADLIFRVQVAPPGFTADAYIFAGATTINGSFTANAVIKKTIGSSFTADAVTKATVSSSLTANAVVFRTQSGSFTGDAFIAGHFAADAAIKKTQTGTFTADATRRLTATGSFTADAVILRTQTGLPGTVNIVARSSGGNNTQTFTTVPISGSAQVGDLLLIAYSHRFGGGSNTWPSGWVSLLGLSSPGQHVEEARYKVLDSGDIATGSVTVDFGALATSTSWVSYLCRAASSMEVAGWVGSADPPSLTPSWGTANTLWIALSSAYTTGGGGGNWSGNITGYPSSYSNGMAPLFGESSIGSAERQLAAASEDPGAFSWVDGPYFPTAATVAVQPSTTFLVADAVTKKTISSSFSANAVIKRTQTGSVTADAVTTRTQSGTFSADSFIAGHLSADAVVRQIQTGSFTANAVVVRPTSAVLTADAALRATISSSFTANAVILRTQSGSFTADAKVTGKQRGKVINDTLNSIWYDQNGGTIDIFQSIDEPSADDNDYIRTDDNPTAATYEGNVQPVEDPLRSDGHILRLRHLKTGSRAATITATLFQAGGDVASFQVSPTQDTAITTAYTLTGAEADSIVDYTRLKIRFVGATTGGGPQTRLRVTWFEFEVGQPIVTTHEIGFIADAVIFRAGQTGSFTANAFIHASFRADATLLRTQPGSFTADAFVAGVGIFAFSGDAVILRTQTGALTADAALRTTSAGAITADAVSRRTQSGAVTADAVVFRTSSASFSADAVLAATRSATFTADATNKATLTGNATADAVVTRSQSGTFNADAILQRERTGAVIADATLLRAQTGSATADAVISRSQSGAFSADSFIAGHLFADAVVRRVQTGAVTADAFVPGRVAEDAVIRRTQTETFTADAFVQGVGTFAFSGDAVVLRTQSGSLTADATQRATAQGQATVDAVVRRTQTGSFTSDALILRQATGAVTADAVTKITATGSLTTDARVSQAVSGSVTADAVLLRAVPGSFNAQAVLFSTRSATFAIDAIRRVTATGSLTTAAVIEKTSPASIAANADILATRTDGITASAVILSPRSGAATLDAYLAQINSGVFVADAIISAPAMVAALTAQAVIRRTQAGSFTASAVVRVAHFGHVEAQLVSGPFAAATLSARMSAATLSATVIEATTFLPRGSSFTVDAVIV